MKRHIKTIAVTGMLAFGLVGLGTHAEAKKCGKKCQAGKANKKKAEQACTKYRNSFKQPCKVVKGAVCGSGWRKIAVFKKGGPDYRACRKKRKNEGLKKVQNAFNATRFLVTAYKAYMAWVSKGSSHSSLPSKIRRLYQPHFSLPLGKVQIGTSSRQRMSGITDCYKMYFQPSKNMKAQLNRGIFDSKSMERFFLHELSHAEQCYQKGGRNNYAAMWFRHVGKVVIENLVKGKKIKDDLHDKMPMEGQAESKALSIQKKTNNYKK